MANRLRSLSSCKFYFSNYEKVIVKKIVNCKVICCSIIFSSFGTVPRSVLTVRVGICLGLCFSLVDPSPLGPINFVLEPQNLGEHTVKDQYTPATMFGSNEHICVYADKTYLNLNSALAIALMMQTIKLEVPDVHFPCFVGGKRHELRFSLGGTSKREKLKVHRIYF